MHICYTLIDSCCCPRNGSIVAYEIVIRTHQMILVEELQALVRQCCQIPSFQEDLTQRLLLSLKEKAEQVTTIGRHSGVSIICEAP